MPITHVITHHTRRLEANGEASISRRNSELPLDGKVEELLRDLKRTYCNRAGKSYGQFSENIGDFPFSSLLKNYCAERSDFASFSSKAMDHFKVELEKGDALADAHLLMWEETLPDASYLFVFMIDHDEALYIDGELSIRSTPNIGSPLLAARVNLTEWQEGGSNYLSLLRMRAEQDLRDAFFNFLGFADQQLDIVADTNDFLEVVDAYSKTLPEEKAQETRSQVVDYCLERDMCGEPVVFEELSNALSDESPQAFSSFAETAYEARKGFEEKAEKKAAPSELIPHRARLRQYLRLSGRNNAMSISFNADCLGKNIDYDHEKDELVLRGLPKSLRTRLLEHLRAGED